MRHICIAVPAHTSQVHVGTASAIIQSVFELAAEQTLVTFHSWAGDSLLPHARNALLAKFLATDCSDLVCVDADISWGPGSLAKLLSHPVDFVAGCYRYKRPEEGYPVNWIPKDELWADPETGLLEVLDVPFGFCRLTRACVERMSAEYQNRAYRHHSAPELDCRALFSLEFRNGQFLGEDYMFCERWRNIGGKVWVDPSLDLTHHDGATGYAGNLGKWLKNR